jgi:hypothetical protein
MHNSSHGIDLLVAGAQEYAPSKVADGSARLQALDLFIEIREVQALQAGSLSVFISEFTASAREHQKGITISCVGRAVVDMPSAVGDAVVQWSLGVLPVLAQWRGKHSCFSASGQVETQGGPFDLLAGPVIARGHSEGASLPAIGGVSLSKSLLPALRNQRLAQRLHWLELFDCKFDDGSVEATCRLDNRDWLAGTKVLADAASAWPTTKEPIQSCRQFVMLLPKNGDTQQIIVPTFWSRLFGRA